MDFLIHMGEGILVEEHGQVEDARLYVDLSVWIAVEEPCGVLRLGVKVREELLHPFDQPLVFLWAGDPLNEKDDVVFWPWRFAVFRLHMIAAGINQHGHVPEFINDGVLRDPVFGIVRVGIVAVRHESILILEVLFIAVVVFEADEGMVVRHQLFEGFNIRRRVEIGIKTVRLIPTAARHPDRE